MMLVYGTRRRPSKAHQRRSVTRVAKPRADALLLTADSKAQSTRDASPGKLRQLVSYSLRATVMCF